MVNCCWGLRPTWLFYYAWFCDVFLDNGTLFRPRQFQELSAANRQRHSNKAAPERYTPTQPPYGATTNQHRYILNKVWETWQTRNHEHPKLNVDTPSSIPTRLMEDLQRHSLQQPATFLQNDHAILLRQDGPAPNPVGSSKHHLQNRFKLWLMKHQIIPTDP
jgi:hypothetical protein